MAMSDRSTNQVLVRRFGALSIDVGTVASITALAAWAKAERFIPNRIESGSGLPVWSTVDQARRDDIAQDSWNRMQKFGNTEYVWTRDSLLTVALVGLGAAALVFLLIPAVVRSTIGKKIFRIRSKKRSTDTGVDGGQLDRRVRGGDSDTGTIDLNDRLSKTSAAMSTTPSSTDGANSEPELLAQEDGLFPNELANTRNSAPLTADFDNSQTGATDDLLPIDVLPLDTTAGVPASEGLTNPTSRSVTPLSNQPIDVEAGGLLGMEVSTEVGSLDSSVETPNAELPDLGFRQPVHSTLSEAATLDGGDEEPQPLPPPPLHRAIKWDPPTAEPAPVWSPETDQLPEVEELVESDLLEQLVETDSEVLSNSGPLTDDSTEVNQTTMNDRPTQATAVVDEEPAASTPPSWNEDWQAWIYWDQTHGQWLRHDVEADVWVPLS